MNTRLASSRTVKIVNRLLQPEWSNSYWLLMEQGLRLLTGVVVGIYVARYLGPERQGALVFFVALGAILSVVSRLGLDAVIIKACIPVRDIRKINDGFFLVALASWLMLAAALAFVAYRPEDLTILAALLFLPFQPFGVVDWCLQAEYRAKYGAAFRSGALVIGAIARIVAIKDAAPVWVFVALPALEQALALVAMLTVAKRRGIYFSTPSKDARSYLAIIKEGAPLLASGLGVILYMKTDQIMIKLMLGDASLGIYSAAVKWYDAWIAVPFLLTVSLYPMLLKSQNEDRQRYRRNLVLLFRGAFWVSAGVSGIFLLFASEIIDISFGSEYSAASRILPVIMFTTCWAALGSCTVRYLAAEGRYGDVFIRTLVGLMTNVAANAALIPLVGLPGAAWATLLCNMLAYYVFDYYDARSGELIAIKNEAIFGIRGN